MYFDETGYRWIYRCGYGQLHHTNCPGTGVPGQPVDNVYQYQCDFHGAAVYDGGQVDQYQAYRKNHGFCVRGGGCGSGTDEYLSDRGDVLSVRCADWHCPGIYRLRGVAYCHQYVVQKEHRYSIGGHCIHWQRGNYALQLALRTVDYLVRLAECLFDHGRGFCGHHDSGGVPVYQTAGGSRLFALWGR